ncbi:MAG: hypothetical protein R2750_03790 [Bacteroidales bacterium]
MWTCPFCSQKFIHQNQNHSCNEKTVNDFLKGKSDHTIGLFFYFIDEYKKLGHFVLHPAKSRIAFAARIRFGYIHRLGKDFVDVVLTFNQPYNDNLCFYRIGEVPGGKIFQHYLRIYNVQDINDEVKKFMKMALEAGS